MKHILRFLKHSVPQVLMVLVLLGVQAYCELALPQYTSDLLNIGLQQGGIEDAVPEMIRADSLEMIGFFLSDEDAAVLENAYTATDSDGMLTLRAEADREQIQHLVLVPECVLYQMDHNEESPVTSEQLKTAVASGMLTKEMLREQMGQALSRMEGVSDAVLEQIAIYYVSEEYEAQGLDLNALRNSCLWQIGGKMLLMSLVMMVISILTGLVASIESAKIGRNLRQEIFAKVMAFTGREMEQFSTASLITRSTNDIQQVQTVIMMLLRMVAYAPILGIVGVVKVLSYSSGMGWIIAGAVAVLAACFGVVLGIAMPKFRRMQTLVDHLNLVSREMLTGIMPVRAFSREKHEEKRFDQANRELYETQLFTNRMMAVLSPFMMLLMNGLSVLIVWVGGHKIDAGVLQIGDLTAFITYSMTIVMGFMILSMVAIFLPRAGVAAGRIAEVLDTEVSLTDPMEPKDAQLDKVKGEITFHDVSFRYPGADGDALEHISFTAEPGKTTAIIGSTGCGKSTLLNLIPRFYDVTEGAVTLDDVDIREISREKLRSVLGYVPQKGVLFSGTIESNLKYAGEQVTDTDVEQAAEIAQAKEFISSKVDGLQTAIAQGGTNVSGGQKQRLAIARAIASHPKVFLFDDSFSALDYKTDLALRKALAEQTVEATVIVVAQRISTVLHADNVLVMSEGKIVGAGSNRELLENCPVYREIAESQLSPAELENIRNGGEA